jgi:1-acyl-sn-glycerol-3-phosphate acyltransferase
MRLDLFYKSTGKNYLWLEPLMHIALRIFFRKIYLYNRQGVPGLKPVLIASNHPTAFVDPILFCEFFDPPVYNMTRGDIFRKPFFRKLMESVNMFPVFRHRDGYGERDRNDETFEYCKNKLRDGHTINIFVEGEHHLDKRVLTPIQKGIARIAFSTFENYPSDDLQIVPVGCNYVFGDRVRDEIKLNVGEPIFVKNYWKTYLENPNAAIASLCSDIETALKSVCYHIEKREDDTLAERLLVLWRSENPASLLPVVEHSGDRFFAEKAVLDRLNTLSDLEKNELREKTDAYFAALEKAGLNDEALSHPEHAGFGWLFFLTIGFVPFVTGGVLSWPVRWLANFATNKLVKKREFRTSILLGVAYLSGLLYCAIFLAAGLITGSPMLISLALLLPLLAWFYLFYREIFARWMAAGKAVKHPLRKELLALRRAIPR